MLENDLVGSVTVAFVVRQIELGELQTVSTMFVFELQEPALQVKVPDPTEIDGSETIDGIALLSTSAES